jgi:hypothetical protein
MEVGGGKPGRWAAGYHATSAVGFCRWYCLDPSRRLNRDVTTADHADERGRRAVPAAALLKTNLFRF